MRQPDRIEPIHKRRLREAEAKAKRDAQLRAQAATFWWQSGAHGMNQFNAALGQQQNPNATSMQNVNWPQSWGARCPGNTAATTCICGCCPKS